VTGPTARLQPKNSDRLPELNLRQLAAVRAVAEYRSFIAAAAHLGISQPALSLAIKRLEQTLELSLFLRTTRQITITAAGREFVAMAERVLNDMKLGMKSLRELGERSRGQVIVTSLVPVSMSNVVAEYRRRFPGIEIQLREGYQEDVTREVQTGLADFGIGDIGDLPETHLTERLGVQELWVMLRHDHPLARTQRVEFKALRDIDMVSLPIESSTRRSIDAAATASGFALRHVVTVGLPITLINLVVSGTGVAVVPAWPRKLHPSLVQRRLVRPRLLSTIGIMRLRDRELSPAAAGLLALSRQRLRIGLQRR
jgi:DNA-binding transcriptional LysR family regulator